MVCGIRYVACGQLCVLLVNMLQACLSVCLSSEIEYFGTNICFQIVGLSVMCCVCVYVCVCVCVCVHAHVWCVFLCL